VFFDTEPREQSFLYDMSSFLRGCSGNPCISERLQKWLVENASEPSTLVDFLKEDGWVKQSEARSGSSCNETFKKHNNTIVLNSVCQTFDFQGFQFL
jgi:hypothetical protein